MREEECDKINICRLSCKRMEFIIPLPQILRENGPTLQNWNLLKGRFSAISSEHDKDMTCGLSLFLKIAGQDVLQALVVMLNESGEENVRAMEAIEDLCLPKFTLLFRRFCFFSRRQSKDEHICRFLLDLENLSAACEFDSNKEECIKDQIIRGVFSDSLRQCLQESEKLDRQKAEEICIQFDGCGKTCCVYFAAYELKNNVVKTKEDEVPDDTGFSVEPVCCEEMSDDDCVVKATPKSIENGVQNGTKNQVERCFAENSENQSAKCSTMVVEGNNKVTITGTALSCAICSKELSDSSLFEHNCLCNSQQFQNSPSVTPAVSATQGVDKHYAQSSSNVEISDSEEDDKIINLYDRLAGQNNVIDQYSDDEILNLRGNEKGDDRLLNVLHFHPILKDMDIETYFDKSAQPLRNVESQFPKFFLRNIRDIEQNVEGEEELLHVAEKQTLIGENEKTICHMCGDCYSSTPEYGGHVCRDMHEQAANKSDYQEDIYDPKCVADQHKHTSRESQQTFICEKCGAIFKHSSGVRQHMRKHHEALRYPCTICDKRFAYLSGLHLHELTHTGERPFICEICGTTHLQLGALNRHLKDHMGIKRHHCPHCKKLFSQSEALKIHIRKHTGETPFVCHECGKGFRSRNSLKIHSRRHTGERPYECKMCKKTFYSSTHLTRHIKIHQRIR